MMMKKTSIVCFFMTVVLCFSFGLASFAFNREKQQAALALEQQAEIASIQSDLTPAEKAGQIAVDAVTALFGDDQGAVNVSSIFQSMFAGMGYVNTAVAFLKLVGVMKDSTAEAMANILEQLNMISDKLNVMDAKLDSIINSMTEFKANAEFNTRTDRAILYRRYFNEFNRDYVTRSLEPLITEFEAMRINSMKNWYNANSADDRKGSIDNSKVILIYDVDQTSQNAQGQEKYVLRYTTSNSVPADFSGRYMILSSRFLPTINDVSSWNIDEYKTILQNYVERKIETDFDYIQTQNYKDFTREGVMEGLLTEEKIKMAAEDAVNLIIYRVVAAEVNKDVRFVLNVLDAFENYSRELLKSENGFDAVLRALYYTHAFEYEISDTIQELFEELVFKTTYYGSFVKDVLGMSGDISKERRNQFDNSYCNTIISLENVKNKALTGHSNFSYITNTLVYYGRTTLTFSGQIYTTADGSSDAFVSYSANASTTTIFKAGDSTKNYSRSNLIGADSACLLSLMLNSNGIVANHEFFVEKLADGKTENNFGTILASLGNEEDLPLDSTIPLMAQNVVGDYFSNGPVTLRALPGDAESKYVHYHKMIKGDVINFVTNSVSCNVPVAAMAIYGESHTLWWDDESAFMGGPNTIPGITREFSTECTKNYGKKHYTHHYTVKSQSNVLICEPIELSFNSSLTQANPLFSYAAQNNSPNALSLSANTPDVSTKVFVSLMITITVTFVFAICCMITALVVRKKQ